LAASATLLDRLDQFRRTLPLNLLGNLHGPTGDVQHVGRVRLGWTIAQICALI